MGLFDEVRKGLMDLATNLPKMNRENRKEIREVVLALESELDRSIMLAILYIDGVSRIKPRQELLDHLYGAPTTLMEAYNQFKICAGLYGLADRFDEVFSTVKGSISIGHVATVTDLIRELSNGERMVIHGLRGMTDMLAESARELEKLSDGADFNERRSRLLDRLDIERNELKMQVAWLRRTVKEVLAKL